MFTAATAGPTHALLVGLSEKTGRIFFLTEKPKVGVSGWWRQLLSMWPFKSPGWHSLCQLLRLHPSELEVGGSTEWRVWGSDGPGLPWFRITSAHVPRAGAQSWGHTGCKGAQEVRSGRQPRKIRFWWLASCLRLRTLRLNLSDMATFFEHCIMVLSQTGFIL